MFRRRVHEEVEPIPDHEAYWWLADQILDNVSDFITAADPKHGTPDLEAAKVALEAVTRDLDAAKDFNVVSEIEADELMYALVYHGLDAASKHHDQAAYSFFDDQQTQLITASVSEDLHLLSRF